MSRKLDATRLSAYFALGFLKNNRLGQNGLGDYDINVKLSGICQWSII